MSANNPDTADISLRDADEPAIKSGSHLSGTARRSLSGRTKLLAVVLAVTVGLYHTITAGIGIPSAYINRPIHLAVLGALVFFWHEAGTGEAKNRVPWYDWLLAGLMIISTLYLTYIFTFTDFGARSALPETLDIFFGGIAIILTLEITRRTTGIILPVLASAFIAYAYLGPIMPGLLIHRGYSIERIISHVYLGTEGLFGIPLGVSATFVVLFIIFGAFLEVTGIGDWFIDIAYGYTGRMSGGPAKTSILASGFMASLNGSAVANTATTGAFTIPLMKRTGFDKHYAAAVESAASSGGQILPPIMGAGAFIMAAWTGISYAEIIVAASIPALLYFLCVGMAVHFQAKKHGLEGLPADELPDSSRLFKQGIHFTIPIVVLVYLLVAGYTPILAGFVAIVLTMIVAIPLSEAQRFVAAITDGDTKTSMNIMRDAGTVSVRAFDRGIRMTLVVAAACATAGIVVGVVSLTGLGLVFSSLIAGLSGGVLIIGLLLAMITSIVLGMGLPTTAAYVVVAALGAPALIELGVTTLAAHLFIFYFAILSAITPPIMLAVFTASGIAESNPWKTALSAVSLAAVGFIIPFVFVYGNELLLMGDIVNILLATGTAIAGVILLAAAIQGFFATDIPALGRVVLLIAAIVLFLPGVMTDGLGLILFSAIALQQYVATNGDVPSLSAIR
jgi:TRAP transporter 4TM/12TM fusion protein